MIESLVVIKTVDNVELQGVVKGLKIDEGEVTYTLEVTSENNLKGKEIEISTKEIFYISKVGE